MKIKKKKRDNRKKKENKKEKKVVIWIIILVLFIFFLVLNLSGLLSLWDENVYLGNARSHIGQSNFTEDFRFPLLEWIVALAWLFTGESLFVARMIIILFTLTTVFLLYLISKRYFTWQLSLFLSALFALSPLILLWGFRVYADVPSMFFVTLSFYFLLKGDEKNVEKNGKKKCCIFIILAGVAAALTFLARFPLALFAFSVLIYFIIKKKPKELLLFIIPFIVTLLPWMVYNQITYHNPLWDVQAQFSVVAQFTPYEPIMKQIQNLSTFTNFLIPLLMIFGIYVLIRKNEKMNYLILIYLVISFIYYLFFVKLKDERYYLTFLPFIYLTAFQAIEWLRELRKKRILTILLIVLVITLMAIALISPMSLVYDKLNEKLSCDRNNSMMNAIDYLRDKTDINDTVLSNAWPWFGYYLNVRAFNFWSNNIVALVDQYKAPYIVYNNKRGIEFDKRILDSAAGLKLEKEFVDKCNERVYIYSTNYAP